MPDQCKVLFLFGNGLSIALSKEFSLQTITEKFINSLKGDEKEYFDELCKKDGKLSFSDFEENFSQLEASYLGLKKYRRFLECEAGKAFLKRFNLQNPDLIKHEKVIKSIYQQYILMILGLIHGKVKLAEINAKIEPFTKFFIKTLDESEKAYVFTLNYDLLAETILLENVADNGFTDFCLPAGLHKKLQIAKYDFDPAICKEYFVETSSDHVELHHLHGSLSSFYDLERNKAIKFKSEDIKQKDIYNKIIVDEAEELVPAIITGGGKSDKVTEYPFDFYYRELKRICDTGEVNKLFIVGYSFRDEHINELIKRWINNVLKYDDGILIVDCKQSENEKEDFKKYVKKQLHMKPAIPDKCFIFDGVNSIKDVSGTARDITKKRKSVKR